LDEADTAGLFRVVRNLREPGWAREVALKRIEEQLEAAEGQSGIYQDALQRIAEGSWAVGSPKYTDQPRKFAKDVLRAQASSPAKEPS
jgi:predicted nucleic acid-binding Zn ribbon protein